MNLEFENLYTLAQKLEELSSFHRIAFAASICERLLPIYDVFSRESGWGDFSILRTVLDEVWDALEKKQFERKRFSQLIQVCEAAIPHADDVTSRYTYEAQDAIAALCYLLEACLHPTPLRITKVVQRATDALKEFIEYEEDSRDPNWAKNIDCSNFVFTRHPLVLREINKQQEDLQCLKGIEIVSRDFIESFRSSCINNGKNLIQL